MKFENSRIQNLKSAKHNFESFMNSGKVNKRRNWTPALTSMLTSMMKVGQISGLMQAADIKAKEGNEFDILKGFDDHILQGHLDKIRLTQANRIFFPGQF